MDYVWQWVAFLPMDGYLHFSLALVLLVAPGPGLVLHHSCAFFLSVRRRAALFRCGLQNWCVVVVVAHPLSPYSGVGGVWVAQWRVARHVDGGRGDVRCVSRRGVVLLAAVGETTTRAKASFYCLSATL